MDALNAAPDRDPFAFELQRALSHSRQGGRRDPYASAIIEALKAAQKLQLMVKTPPVNRLVTALGF
ncbi:MAG: hypothetical protein QE283_03335 [Rhodoferax sp.]|nr:hypothetical protein [Rhodoferax sp.]